jgi:hypothetical protein
MARRPAKVVLNRAALAAIDLDMAVGLETLAQEVLRVADVPDQPPYGVGLVDRGGVISFVDGKRVGGDRAVTRRPRDLMTRKGTTVAVGFSFPAKFQEMGTENQPARPFLTPAVMRVVGSASVVESALRTALADVLGRRARRNIRQATR